MAIVVMLAGACTRTASPPSHAPSPSRSRSPRDHRHVVLIVMENHEYSSIIGSPEAPYLNQLAGRYALATRYFANTHPSLPNYLDLLAGEDFGVHDDGEAYVFHRPTVVDQLEHDGLTWGAYMDGMAGGGATPPCSFPSGGDRYAKKHDPFAYFGQIQASAARCRNVVPYSRFSADLGHGLRDFTWITPNQCHDMHSCPIATGDAWLARNVPPIIEHLSGKDLLFVVFDEGATDEQGGGHVACIVAGPGAMPNAASAIPYSHFSLLRTIEDVLGLPHLAHAADPDVTPMDALLG